MSRRTLISNSLFTLVIRGATLGVRILAIVMIAKITNESTFSMIAYLMAFTEIFRVLADLGLDTFIVRYISQSKDKINDNEMMSISLSQKSIFSFFFSILYIIIFTTFFSEFDEKYIILFSVLSVSPMLLNFSINYYLAKANLKSIVVSIILGTLLTLCSFFYFWYKEEVFLSLLCIVIGELLVAVVLVFRIKKRVKLKTVSIRKVLSNAKLHYSIGIAMLIAVTYSRLDIIFVEWFLGKDKTALYGFAQRVTEPAVFIIGAFSVNAYTLISRIYSDDQNNFFIRLKRIIFLFFLFGFFMAGASILVSSILVNLYFVNYIYSLNIIYFLSAAIIFKSLNLSLTSTILAMGRFKVVTYINMINLVTSIVFIYMFIKVFGVIGAALAIACVEAVNSILQSVYVIRRCKLKQLGQQKP